MKRKIKKLMLYILNIPLYWIAKLIPKNDDVWIFGAWLGEKYADNSKYLFEYINEFHPQIRTIWLTNNNEILNRLNSEGFEVYKQYSLKAIIIGMKAKYSIFVHSNSYDCMMFLNNRTKLIQLWHGIPLKKIGYDDTLKFSIKNNFNIKYLFFPFLNEFYDLCISTSDEDKSKFLTAFNSKDVVISGYPRNDVLYRNESLDKKSFIITYLPTFRDNIGSEIDLFTDFGFKIDKWNSILSNMNIKFNIKMHPVNKPKDDIIKDYSRYECINFLNEKDVAEILQDTDILITDYSSVFFDYLLTNRPIIFAPFDINKYLLKDREFYYDYNEVTPGPKCDNWDEVLDWIIKFKVDQDLFKKEREVVKNKFHKYQDENSCERVFYEILSLSK